MIDLVSLSVTSGFTDQFFAWFTSFYNFFKLIITGFSSVVSVISQNILLPTDISSLFTTNVNGVSYLALPFLATSVTVVGLLSVIKFILGR